MQNSIQNKSKSEQTEQSLHRVISHRTEDCFELGAHLIAETVNQKTKTAKNNALLTQDRHLVNDHVNVSTHVP